MQSDERFAFSEKDCIAAILSENANRLILAQHVNPIFAFPPPAKFPAEASDTRDKSDVSGAVDYCSISFR